jgi:hypothetical protein
MRNHELGIAFALGIVLSCSPPASAQTKRPVKAAKAPSSAQAGDLSGVWMLDRPRLQTVVERYWIYEFTPEEPPMTAWGEAQYKAAKSSFGTHSFPLAETNDPIFRNCSPTGFPRIFTHPFPMQVVQTPGEVIMLFEWDSARHEIFADGRPHNTALGPLWMGDSIGHWEGDTLVADTVNFNDKTGSTASGIRTATLCTLSNESGGLTTTIWWTTSPSKTRRRIRNPGRRNWISC